MRICPEWSDLVFFFQKSKYSLFMSNSETQVAIWRKISIRHCLITARTSETGNPAALQYQFLKEYIHLCVVVVVYACARVVPVRVMVGK